MSRSLTVITSHFGDIFWVKNLFNRLSLFDDGSIHNIYVIDQSRESGKELASIFGPKSVLSFELDSVMIQNYGHDHPTSVNKALRTVNIRSSHILIIDNDCFPRSQNWLDNSAGDFVFASDPVKKNLTHPCFALFPTTFKERIDFTLGSLNPITPESTRVDFGRTLALQTKVLGFEAIVSPCTRETFGGFKGYSYFNSSIYHHGSASFMYSQDSRLQNLARTSNETIYKKQISKDIFELSLRQRLFIMMRELLKKVRR
jgi:hypothetical protein